MEFNGFLTMVEASSEKQSTSVSLQGKKKKSFITGSSSSASDERCCWQKHKTQLELKTAHGWTVANFSFSLILFANSVFVRGIRA